MKRNFHEEIRKNKIESIVIMFLFIVLIALLGAAVGLYIGDMITGVSIAVIVSLIYTVIAYYAGTNMILAMSHAKEADKKQYAHLINSVEGLAIAAGIPTPKVYVINDTALNAFATGRDPKHAAVTVTTGLMDRLNRQELEGVIAHEIAHIQNYDVRLMMLAAILVGIVTLLSDMLLRTFLFSGSRRNSDSKGGSAQVIFIVLGLVLAILAPLIAQLLKLAVSRKREYVADANGAKLTRYPPGLADALEKIRQDPDPLVDTANRATAHLYISTPFAKKKTFWTNLFSTHPPIEERIKRLREM